MKRYKLSAKNGGRVIIRTTIKSIVEDSGGEFLAGDFFITFSAANVLLNAMREPPWGFALLFVNLIDLYLFWSSSSRFNDSVCSFIHASQIRLH